MAYLFRLGQYSVALILLALAAQPALQQSCPPIEVDVDYPGNDIHGIPSTAAENCCGICAATPNCLAFSYAYGTCYLKSAKGSSVRTPGVQSGTVATCPSIENDIDYAGGDLKAVAASTVNDCCGHCKATTDCKLYSYAYGTCYLKHTQGTRLAKAGVHSAVVVASVDPPTTTTAPPPITTSRPLPGQCYPPVQDIDYAGMDVATIPGSSSTAQCCDACSLFPSCNVYVFYQGNCYLKSAKGRSSALPGAVASARSTFAPTCAAIEDNVDFPGGDLIAAAKSTAEECCDVCRATSGCALFTWAWGTCYLKSTQGARQVSWGARSMVVVTTPPPPTTFTPRPTTTPPLTTPPPTTTTPTPTPSPPLSPPTPTPVVSCGKRQRKAWSASSAAEKELYISAVEESMKRGLYQRFLSVHNDLKANKEAHGTCVFLFWHRKFLVAFEDMLRSLAPAYACMTLAYWDYTQDYVRFQTSQCKTIADCSVATADLGGSTHGRDPQPADPGHSTLCVTSRPLNASVGGCVRRGDWHATAMPDWSISNARSSLFDVGPSIAAVSYDLEIGIHGSVHMELRGQMGNGFLSPQDPIFYLHHAMVDVLHTVFYHCKVEPLNLDPIGQQTHPSSFQGCTVNYGDGAPQPVGPTTAILMRSHVDLDDNVPIPVDDDPLIGHFFKPLPSEYFKLTDARTLGYSYNLVGLLGDLYAKCDSTRQVVFESEQFADEHTITAPLIDSANAKTLRFEEAIVAAAIAQGLSSDAAYVEVKKINLLLHVNCFGGQDIQDYPDELKQHMHWGTSQKPGFVLWHQLKTNQTTVAISGWQHITQAYYNCSGAMKH